MFNHKLGYVAHGLSLLSTHCPDIIVILYTGFIFQKLRHNLSMNQSIKQSMACEVSSVSISECFNSVSICQLLNLNRVTKNLSLGITVRHHEASLLMPISDPHDRFFYPHHTPMIDTYILRPCTVYNNSLGESDHSNKCIC